MRSEIVAPIVFLMILTLSTVLRLYFYYQNSKQYFQYEHIEGYILSHPFNKDGFQNFQVKSINIKTGVFPKYRLGDYVVIIAKNNGSTNSVYYPKIEVQENRNLLILNKISIYRENLIFKAKRNLPEPYAGLILGMTMGYRDDFPHDFLDLLKRTGTIHIIVVSGYNVAIVILFISFVFTFFGRKINLLFVIISVLAFACLAGLDPPVVRASIMGLIAVIGTFSGNSRMSLYVLYITLLIMLLINPSYLFDIGFQLSGVATGTVILASMITTEVTFSSVVFVSSFVNLALIPPISYYFGTISLISLVSNLMILWIVPFVTFGGFVFFVFPIFVIKVFLVFLIDFYIVITKALGSLEFASIDYRFSVAYIFTYYLVLFFIYLFIFKWKRYLNESN